MDSKVTVKITYDRSMPRWEPTVAEVLDNGVIVVRSHDEGTLYRDSWRDLAVSAVQAAFRATTPTGTYIRCTNDKAEIERARSRSLRPSRNHLDGAVEAGLSVAEGYHYAGVAGYDYAYLVRGERCGTGSDGEPLLDVATLSVAGGIKSAHSMALKGRRESDKLAARRGWTRDMIASVMSKRWVEEVE